MKLRPAPAAEAAPAEAVIIETQHFVSATTLLPSIPDQTFNKLERIIAGRWPGKTFRIQTLSVFPAGNGFTISALIEEIAE